MPRGEMIVNEDGVWFDYEETVTNLQEFQFTEAGMFLNDELMFTWEEIGKIKYKLGLKNTF